MTPEEAIAILDQDIDDPAKGLSDEIFYFISRTTPLVNVDLLIKDESGRTLLAWRDDKYSGTGWHVPGGIVRYKETFEARVEKVAETEIGAPVRFEADPIAINQLIHHENENRGHFISILYRCFLAGSFVPKNTGLRPMDPGYLMWHEKRPDNMIIYHDIYKHYI